MKACGVCILTIAILVAVVVGAGWYKSAIEKHVVHAYQFDWTISAIRWHLEKSNGDWPKDWQDVESALSDLTNDEGSIPWSVDQIRENVNIDFMRRREFFVNCAAVGSDYEKQRNEELELVAARLRTNRRKD